MIVYSPSAYILETKLHWQVYKYVILNIKHANFYKPLILVSKTDTLMSLSKSRVLMRISATRRNSEKLPMMASVSSASTSVRE